MLKRIGGALVLGALIATSLIAVGAPPANAAKAEITISSLAWWWEDATSEERDVPNVGTVTIETPNPFCPGAPSGLGSPAQSCAEGRLPIEVHNGDYETQNKISGVGFDFSLIPIGSKVNKFTVTFREAKEGCYDKDGQPDENPDDDVCETTSPLNVGEHQIQACLVSAFFGDGEARMYKEAPRYECTNADPLGVRKEVNSDKDGEGSNFYWTFDLTKYAQQWTAKFSAVTGVMLVGAPVNKEDDDTWRVVLTGPKFENGVVTELDYIPGEDPLAVPPTTTDPGTGTTTTTTTTGTGFGDTGTTGTVGSTGSGDITGGDTGAAPTPAPSGSPVLSVGEAPEVQELPGYIWLAVLAGLVGFSLVRSIVIEKTTGIRPDGVLATIHRLNAERGTAVAATPGTSGPLAGVMGALGGGARKIGGVFGKLSLRKKG